MRPIQSFACALLIAAAMIPSGCATSNLPKNAQLVGGGISVDWQAPSAGTVVLIEKTSGRLVGTRSLDEGDHFRFGPDEQGTEEVVSALFGDTLPSDASFVLYFIPKR